MPLKGQITLTYKKCTPYQVYFGKLLDSYRNYKNFTLLHLYNKRMP